MAYIGNQEAYPIVMDGLRKLEYRGYDSTGVAIMNGALHLFKSKGKVNQLADRLITKDTSGYLGIGHTRWATHGLPNDANAHPHTSEDGRLVMVHNGIIENYESLKIMLAEKGFTFKSETDSEVLVQYIRWNQITHNLTLEEALRLSLADIEGAYALAIFDTTAPEELFVSKQQAPLVVGLSTDGFYIGSDASAISEYIDNLFYLDDGNIARLYKDGAYKLTNLTGDQLIANVEAAPATDVSYELGSYDHYMQKEITEQPELLNKLIQKNIAGQRVQIDAILQNRQHFLNAKRIIIVACGTSWHAALIAEYMIEEICGIPVEVEYASEFRYRNPIIYKDDIIIGISQSGETADTLAAIELANDKGAFTYSLLNTPNSTIARISNAVTLLHIGKEIGVASTKAFTGQVTLLYMISLQVGDLRKTISIMDMVQQTQQVKAIPTYISSLVHEKTVYQNIVKTLANSNNALFLGRGINFPMALEGALKLKEISYIHAEGYPAAEMKHGPIALIDKDMPVIVIATAHDHSAKLISNIAEIKARGAKTIIIRSKALSIPDNLIDIDIVVPYLSEMLSPIISAIPLQLLAYYIADERNCDIDQPRNLAKSVTVE